MSVLVDHPATLLAYHPNRLTAMVVAGDPRVRASVTRHLWTLGVRDVVEASSVAEARTRIARPRDLCVVDVNLPDGSGLSLLAELRAAGWPNSLALSACDDAYGVRAAFASGVKCYVVTGSRVMPGPGGRPVSQYRDQAYHVPAVRCPRGRSRCCGWWRTAGPTRRSARPWDCRRSRSKATWPGSPASSARATGPVWWRPRCGPASSAEQLRPGRVRSAFRTTPRARRTVEP